MRHPRDQHAWLRALGATLLAGIATFFAAQALWRPAIGRYVARAVVEQSGGRLDVEAARATVAQSAALEATPPALRSTLVVYRAFDAAQTQAERFAIELTDAEERVAVDAVAALARQFVESHRPRPSAAPAPVAPELAAAQARLASARAEEDAARRVLDSLVAEHFVALRELNVASAPLAVKPAAESKGAGEKSEGTRLREQIAALETKREGLLGRLTTEHPQVQDVDAALAELRSRQAQLPREKGRFAPVDGQPAPPDDVEALLASVRELAAGRQPLRMALAHYETARASRLEAEATVDVLSQPTEAASAPTVAKFTLAEPARIVERVPVMSPVVRLAVLLVASLLASVVTLVLLRPRLDGRLLQSVTDIETALDLPVIARIGLARPERAGSR